MHDAFGRSTRARRKENVQRLLERELLEVDVIFRDPVLWPRQEVRDNHASQCKYISQESGLMDEYGELRTYFASHASPDGDP